jgi:hypothetical protein
VRAGNQRLGRQHVVGGELDAPAAAGNRAEAPRHNCDVVRGLILEDPQLRVAVALERAVPVEVVRLEVEEDRDPRLELLDVFQLEARELADDPVRRLGLTHELAQRGTDVPGRPRAEHRAQQLGRGRLAVGTGDADERVRQEARGELDLAPDRDPALARRDDERRLARDARALDEHVDAVEQAEVGVVAERPVGRDDLRAPRLERRLRRQPGARKPEHEHPVHLRRNWR